MTINQMDWRGPLFIVGASRSGSTMLRSILNNASAINLAGETHYFDDLRPRFIEKCLMDMSEDERAYCLDYFRSLDVRPYGMAANPEQSPLLRTELLGAASDLGDNADSLFQAYCQMRTRHTDAIWGEKTPRHVFRIDDIISAFPGARIVCIIRDVRGMVASYRDWTYQGGLPTNGNADYERAIKDEQTRIGASYNIAIASLMWRAAANAALAAMKKYGTDRIQIVKYEDLINDPEPVLSALLSWIGVEFTDTMLDIPLQNSSTTEFSSVAGLKKSVSMRWQSTLTDQEIHIIQTITQNAMRHFGYIPLPVKASFLSVPKAYLTVPGAIFRAANANRSRHNSLPDYILRRVRAAFR